MSNGGNSNNDNKYYECTGPNCDRVQVQADPIRDREEDRNVFFQDPTTSTTTTSTTSVPNLLENITIPGGNQAINLNIPPGVAPPTDLQEAIERGGNINVNCDRVNGCTTIIPPGERLVTTTTTARPQPFRISLGPLFGHRRQPQTEAPLGTDTLADVHIKEVEELPRPGLGEDIIDEVFKEKPPDEDLQPVSAFQPRPNNRNSGFTNSNRISNLNRGSNRVSSLPGLSEPARSPGSSSPGNRVADIPSDNQGSGAGNKEDLRSIVQALSGLIQILNTTSKGKRRNNRPLTTLPIGHLGNKRYPIKNIIFDDAPTFGNVKTHNLPDGETIYYSVKQPLPTGLNPLPTTSSPPRSTIPPHLIPLGPDGAPLVRPDGSFIAPSRSGLPGRDSHLSQMFPYLKDRESIKVTPAPVIRPRPTNSPTSLPKTTTHDPNAQEAGFVWDLLAYGLPEKEEIAQKKEDIANGVEHEEDHRNMITRAIETMRDMPMEEKRHMLAGMMFTIPMAAVTMAAVGVPHLAIAPLATVIPGFMFAAFTDVNHHPDSGSAGHQAHGHHGAGDIEAAEDLHDSTDNSGHNHRRTGLSGVLDAIRTLSANRRQNQTLHLRTTDQGSGGHHHG